MKIEKMCTKADVLTNLRKAGNYSKLVHLNKLAEYIQREIELDDLRDALIISSYEIKVGNGKYQVCKIKSQYSSDLNAWEQIEEEKLFEISIGDIENFVV